MKAHSHMDQTDSCESSRSSDTHCLGTITFEDRQALNWRLANSVQESGCEMVHRGYLPQLSIGSENSAMDDSTSSCAAPTAIDSDRGHAGKAWLDPAGDDCSAPQASAVPTDTPPPLSDSPAQPTAGVDSRPVVSDTVPSFNDGTALQGGLTPVELGRGDVPEALKAYASYEGGKLVIDARGQEIPPLEITRDDVVIRNARIRGYDGPSIGIHGASNVVVEGCEISGGQRGVLADNCSNISVQNSWLHDFRWAQAFDTSAVEFDNVSGGTIDGNRITGLYKSDAISMFESRNLRVTNNNEDITIDEPSSTPLMVEGSTSSGIVVAHNVITYQGSNNVPPGLLGGSNQQAYDNIVNGSSSASAWQLYPYNDVWQGIVFEGQLVSPT